MMRRRASAELRASTPSNCVRCRRLSSRSAAVYAMLLASPIVGCASPMVPAPAAVTPAAPCGGQFTGPDARPVSRSSVSNWYITNGQLAYAVFIRGEPGWYDRRTSWDNRTDSLGRFVQEFDVGGFQYDLVFDPATGQLSVSGTSADARRQNVVFVERVGDSLRVVGAEQHIFCWDSPPDAAAEIFERSPGAVGFVSGAPVPD